MERRIKPLPAPKSQPSPRANAGQGEGQVRRNLETCKAAGVGIALTQTLARYTTVTRAADHGNPAQTSCMRCLLSANGRYPPQAANWPQIIPQIRGDARQFALGLQASGCRRQSAGAALSIDQPDPTDLSLCAIAVDTISVKSRPVPGSSGRRLADAPHRAGLRRTGCSDRRGFPARERSRKPRRRA